MCFALYAARDAHAMRHYDVKLLNFLLADFAPEGPPPAALEDEPAAAAAAAALFSPGSATAAAMAAGRSGAKSQGPAGVVTAVRYGLGPHVYRLALPAEQVGARVDGWMDGYMDGWMDVSLTRSSLPR